MGDKSETAGQRLTRSAREAVIHMQKCRYPQCDCPRSEGRAKCVHGGAVWHKKVQMLRSSLSRYTPAQEGE